MKRTKKVLTMVLAAIFILSCSILPVSAATSNGAVDIAALEKFANDNGMQVQVLEKSENTKNFISFDTIEEAEQFLKALKDSTSEVTQEPVKVNTDNSIQKSVISPLSVQTVYLSQTALYLVPSIPPVPVPYTQHYTVQFDPDGIKLPKVTDAYPTGALIGVNWKFIRDNGTDIYISGGHAYIAPRALMMLDIGISINGVLFGLHLEDPWIGPLYNLY